MERAHDWEQLETEVVADFSVFCVRRNVTRSPRTGDPHEFHVLDVPPCVKVIPFTDDGRVVLVEQYRQAVRRLSLEFPAGIMEVGEDPVEAAVRELEEETGYRVGDAELIAEFDPDPSIQANVINLVIARGCSATGERDQDDGEDVAVRLVRPGEITGMITRGEIRHSAAITAWFLYERLGGAGK